MKVRLAAILTFALIVGVFLSPPAQAQSLTGAIFTTLSDGSRVNANLYESKCAVYLDGGPGPNAPAHAAGLPDGQYYFQVTDPNGKNLMSTDPATNRQFQVTNGVIVACTGFGGPVHPVGYDQDHPELGAITIGLANINCPADYLDSPNGGGVYKVWVTRVEDFVGDPSTVANSCGNGCYHGFIPSKSKTDNFKAKAGTPTFCLTVGKGIIDEEGAETPGANWQMFITDPLGVENRYYTGEDGWLRVCGLSEGLYTVREDLVDGYYIDDLIVNGEHLAVEPVYSFTWSVGKAEPVIVFKNFWPGEDDGSGGGPQD